VIQELGAELPESYQSPEALTRRVTVTNDGDLFTIQVTAETPELAARIANTWVNAYERQVNELFSVEPASAATLEAQAEQAKSEYEASQAAVVAFLNVNPVETLIRERTRLSAELDDQVAVENKLRRLAADVQALRTRLLANDATVSAADALTQILIQTSALSNGGAENSFQLDVSLAWTRWTRRFKNEAVC
jgi:hypothetical protein